MNLPDVDRSCAALNDADRDVMERFGAELSKLIDVDAVVLFGSRARGEALRWSDYDVAVVSRDFAGKNPIERMDMAQKAWPEEPVEFVCYTPEEFQRARGLIVWDILDDGIVFVDTGLIRQRSEELQQLLAEGRLTRIPGGWKGAA